MLDKKSLIHKIYTPKIRGSQPANSGSAGIVLRELLLRAKVSACQDDIQRQGKSKNGSRFQLFPMGHMKVEVLLDSDFSPNDGKSAGEGMLGASCVKNTLPST